jgi:hypothetical protein
MWLHASGAARLARTMLAAVALISMSACAHVSGERSAAARAAIDEVLRNEAEFAVAADATGVVPAFRQYVGPDAIMFLPYPMIINPRLATANWPGNVDWRPSLAVASSAGDIVVTSGPSMWTTDESADPGFYFTIWRRQGDGAYRFVLDGSAVMASDLYNQAGYPLIEVISAPAPNGPAAAEIEAAFAAHAASSAREAYANHLDARSHVLRSGRIPAIGEADAAMLLAQGPGAVTYLAEGGGGAESHDVAWSYGRAQWRVGERARAGVYVRVWRFDGSRWRIALDYLAAVGN